MKAIVQIDIPLSKYQVQDKESPVPAMEDYVSKYSKKAVAGYAAKYGHEHIIMTEPVVKYNHPVWERLDFWFNSEWLDKYEEVLYLDTDVFPLPTAPDIFAQSDNDVAYKRIPYWKADKPLTRGHCFAEYPERAKEVIFNAGVILINKALVDATLETVKDYKNPKFPDDSVLLNYAIMKSNLPIENIDKRFNVKLLPDHLKQKKLNVFFFHAMGLLKNRQPLQVEQFLEKIYGKV
jgi:hypothetical protein